MKTKEERNVRILKTLFGIMLLFVIGILCFGELLMPREDPTESGVCALYDGKWDLILSDGTIEEVVLPGHYEVERNTPFQLKTLLPAEQQETWFCMRASLQDMHVYVDGELRKEYSTKGTRLFGRNSASAFVFFKVTEQDAGKILTIELQSDSEYSGFLNEVYVGDKYDIAATFIKQCSLVILVSLCMLILSAITVLIGVTLRLIYKVKMDITYLGLGILQLSLAMIAESRIRQFFLPNSSVAAHVGFWLTMLIPYPFMVYVSRIQKRRYEKVYKRLSLCVAANFVLSTLLQVFVIVDFEETMYISYGLIILMVITIAITIGLDIKKGLIGEYGEVIAGIIAMLFVTIWETYITFVPESPYFGGVVLSIGLIILLLMAAFKTARDMLTIEKEKQMAIVAAEAKTQFLANMSHEIRTPINTIIGMNEMILRENQNEAVAEYARNVHNASGLLLGIINDILDFSKIEAGKMDIVESDYYLSELLMDVCQGTRIKAAGKGLSFTVNMSEMLPAKLKGDEIKIRQILNNLLSNAVKYTHQGSVIISVKAAETEDFALSIAVQDTGMGIKAEEIDKLFDSFRRLEQQKNRNIEGTGLGLNITRQLVDLMGGSISVQSEYGKGSCFTVILPQTVVDATPMGKLEEAYKSVSESKEAAKIKLYAPKARILVVDDNEMNLAVVKALLKQTGIKPVLALNGMECLELCRKQSFDLILMDHMMPNPDGIETLHMLQKDADSLNRETKVIVLTANAVAGVAEKYKAEGFVDYLSKPIISEELEAMIYGHLPKELLEEELGKVVLDKKAAMRYCANSEELYREMAATYCAQSEKYLVKLPEYLEAKDWKQYSVIVHALKSTSLVIGATEFSEKAKRLENAAKEEDEALLLAETPLFLEEYKALIELLK